jgi:hypothetical protein
MMGCLFAYLFVYRKFFAPKSVLNSLVYHQTIKYIENSDKIKKYLGNHIQVMNCNGKIFPLSPNVTFDLIVFGSNQRGKLNIKSHYDKNS